MNVLAVDQNVVGGQVSVRRGHPVQRSYRCTHLAEDRLRMKGGGFIVVEQFNERATVEVLKNELTSIVVQVPHARHRQPCFSSSNQQTRFADHPSNTKTVVEVWVTP